MYEPPPGYDAVFRTKQSRECGEARLVLESVGISAEAIQQDGWWMLVVSSNDLQQASSELDAYRLENSERAPRATNVPLYAGAPVGVIIYAVVLIVIAVFSDLQVYGMHWKQAGGMVAGNVMAGEWWRTVTALTLHVDSGHILSNLAFGVVFGLFAGRILGGGVAWLAIVIAGALGNFMNAVVQDPLHSSIGASTAVFAALGVIVAHALRPRSSTSEKWFRRWSPLICGVVLLAFTGVGGERTDVTAHATGFLAGLLIGWVGCRLPSHWLSSHAIQQWSGGAAFVIVAVSWAIALAVAG